MCDWVEHRDMPRAHGTSPPPTPLHCSKVREETVTEIKRRKAHWHVYASVSSAGPEWIAEHRCSDLGPEWDNRSLIDHFDDSEHEYGSFPTWQEAMDAALDWNSKECWFQDILDLLFPRHS